MNQLQLPIPSLDKWVIPATATATAREMKNEILPFQDLFVLIVVEGPVVVDVVPGVPGQMVGLILHQPDGHQNLHYQLFVLLLQSLCKSQKNKQMIQII